MTKYILYIMLLFLIGCNSSSEQSEEIVDDSRSAVIELNQRYNELYQVVMKEYLRGNAEYEAAGVCLQALTKEIMAVNKALHIDCKMYGENGSPQMVEDKYGNLSPIEILPNELKIED